MKPTTKQLNDPEWWNEHAGSASHYCPKNSQFYDARLHPCCISRPPLASIQWRGPQDGLPPAGTECRIVRISNDTPACSHAIITYQGEGAFCYRSLQLGITSKEYPGSHEDYIFHPLISKEQAVRDKAVELAKKTFDDVSDEFPPVSNKALDDLFYKLYDAGMLVDPSHKPFSYVEAQREMNQKYKNIVDSMSVKE